MKRLLDALFAGWQPPPPDLPHPPPSRVLEPKPHRPGGLRDAVAIAEPVPDPAVEVRSSTPAR